MKQILIASALVLLPSSLLAEPDLVRQMGALPASYSRLPMGETVLSLAVSGEIVTPSPHRWPGSGRVQGTLRRIVAIDGTLMEVEENWLRDRIAEGTLVVVYPGTRTPWAEGVAAPDYPPRWIEGGGLAQTNG